MSFFDIIKPRKDVTGQRISQLHFLLRASFGNVKRDTSLIFQWLHYFNQKIIQQDHGALQQEQLISELKKELLLVPKKEDIRRIIEETYAYEDLLNRLNLIEKRISMPPHTALPSSSQDVIELHKRLERLEQKKSSLKEKLIKKIAKNSKDYVTSVLVSLIKKYENISALQLKEMIVEEQGLCSKSSFYRMLEEIEQRDDVGVVKKGKEKHYIAKLAKQT